MSIASQQNGSSSSENTLDTIGFSGNSGTAPLLAKSALILPTMHNVQILSSALKDELSNFFRDNGISTKPPVELSVNGEGRIEVKGDREDAARIEELINADPTLADNIRTLNAIAGIAQSLPEHLQFQAEYRASRNPEAVVAKYSHLFNQRETHEYSMRFGGGDSGDSLELMVDGETWSWTNVPTSAWIEGRITNLIDTAENTIFGTLANLNV